MIKLRALIDTLARITERRGNRLDDVNVVVEVYNPGAIGGTPCVQVTSVELGIDWDANKLIIRPDKTLSVLNDEEKSAILESIKKAQSWHAYQEYKKLDDKITQLKKTNKEMIKTLKGCEQTLLYINQTGLLTGDKAVHKDAINMLETSYHSIQALKI